MNLVKYDKRTTYMFPNGGLATPEVVLQKYPAVAHFTHVIETDGEVLFAIENLSAMRKLHGIDAALSETDAIVALEAKFNEKPEPEPSAEERTAAALEFLAIAAMPDQA